MSILATARLNYAWAECMRSVRVNPLGAGVRGSGGAPCLGRECLRDFDVPSTPRPSQLPLTLHAWLRASIEIEFTASDGPRRLDKRKRLRSHLFRCPFTTFHFISAPNCPRSLHTHMVLLTVLLLVRTTHKIGQKTLGPRKLFFYHRNRSNRRMVIM